MLLLFCASCSALQLDAWSRLPDGRVTGTLGDRTVWLNVASRSRTAPSTHAAPLRYVETISGARYELGERRVSGSEDSDPAPSRAWARITQPAAAWIRQPWHEDLPLKLASVAGAAVLVKLSGLGLAADTHSAAPTLPCVSAAECVSAALMPLSVQDGVGVAASQACVTSGYG